MRPRHCAVTKHVEAKNQGRKSRLSAGTPMVRVPGLTHRSEALDWWGCAGIGPACLLHNIVAHLQLKESSHRCG
jgi:hypothetical protein